MKLCRLAFLALALAACTTEPGSDFAGSWSVARTVDATPDGCPAISIGSIQIHVDGTTVTADDTTDIVGSVDEEGELQFSSYEWVGEYDTVGGHSLFYDADTDELTGAGSIGCSEGCTYHMTLHAVRVD